MNTTATLARHDPAVTRRLGYLCTLAPVAALLLPLAQWLAAPYFGVPWWINVEKLVFLAVLFYGGSAVLTLLAARHLTALRVAVLCNGLALMILLAALRRFQPPFADGLDAGRPMALAMVLAALIALAAGVIARLRSGSPPAAPAPAIPSS